MERNRSVRHRIFHVLGLIAVFSGAMFVYAGVQIANRRLLKYRLRRDHRDLARRSAEPISKHNFPISYFRKELHPGMAADDVDQIIEGGRKTVRRDELFKGSFAYVYHFPFSLIQRHRLVVLFDDDSRLIGIDGYQISVDLL